MYWMLQRRRLRERQCVSACIERVPEFLDRVQKRRRFQIMMVIWMSTGADFGICVEGASAIVGLGAHRMWEARRLCICRRCRQIGGKYRRWYYRVFGTNTHSFVQLRRHHRVDVGKVGDILKVGHFCLVDSIGPLLSIARYLLATSPESVGIFFFSIRTFLKL